MGTDEVLVVGYDARDLDRWPVTARVPPHIAVLRADRDDLTEIARHVRLAMVRLPDGGVSILGDDTVLDELDDAGRLFINAWRDRPAGKPGRIGDGLPWDTNGFQPPDQPRR
jgi:hypothetical protein